MTYTKADGKRIFVATVDMRDNTHLSEADILQFEKTLTEEEKEARIHGKFMHLTGLVYKDFDPDIHIIDPQRLKRTGLSISLLTRMNGKLRRVYGWLLIQKEICMFMMNLA